MRRKTPGCRCAALPVILVCSRGSVGCLTKIYKVPSRPSSTRSSGRDKGRWQGVAEDVRGAVRGTKDGQSLYWPVMVAAFYVTVACHALSRSPLHLIATAGVRSTRCVCVIRIHANSYRILITQGLTFGTSFDHEGFRVCRRLHVCGVSTSRSQNGDGTH
jgi:hypothetical protein